MVLQFLAYSTPQFVYYVIPIAALLSVLVTFGLLSRTSELTVMKACGVSLYRIALPVVALSLVWSAALFGLEQEILARANRRAERPRRHDSRPAAEDAQPAQPSLGDRRGTAASITTAIFDPQQRVLTGLSIYTPAPNAWRLASQTYAATAQYTDEGWVAHQRLDAGPRRRAPRPGVRSLARRITVEPPGLLRDRTDRRRHDDASPQLRRYVAELSASGFDVAGLSVELQRKLAFPLVTFVMTLLAVPFGVSTGRRGTLYGIGLGVVIALSYWFLMSVFIAIGKAGILPPVLAAWTPNIIVAAVAVYLLLTAKT